MRVVQAAQVTTTDELRAKVAAAQEEITAAEAVAVRMCQQLQNELDDCQRRHGDGHDESAIPVPVVEENIIARSMAKPERPNDVDHHRGKTGGIRLEGAEMQVLLADTALASARRRSN